MIPMNTWIWYLTRSTGIVAAILAVASLVWGLFFSTTAVHAYQSGSDSLSAYFTKGMALLAGLAVYPLSVRLIGVVQHRRPAAVAAA